MSPTKPANKPKRSVFQNCMVTRCESQGQSVSLTLSHVFHAHHHHHHHHGSESNGERVGAGDATERPSGVESTAPLKNESNAVEQGGLPNNAR